MLLPEFCKTDALEAIQTAQSLLELPPKKIHPALEIRISMLLLFLEAAKNAAPLIPKRLENQNHEDRRN